VHKLGRDGKSVQYGTGTVLTSCGLIMTAAHVILRSRVVLVRRLWLDRKRWHIWRYSKLKADVIYRDHRTDIAIIKLRKPPKDLEVMAFGDSDAIGVGSPLFRVGRDRIPLGAGYVVSVKPFLRGTRRFRVPRGSGYVLEKKPYVRRMRMLHVGMDVHSAASGGPVCNQNGELIGVCLERQDDDSTPPLAHVVSLEDVRRRVLNRKNVREHLEHSPETAHRICGPP
jgi:putative serine protease PepD